VPDGANVAVERGNVVRYIHFMANHRLNVQLRAQSAAFLRGFQDLVKPQWIKMFDEEELQMLISGSLEGLDLKDLQTHSSYSGGFTAEHPVICWLWETLAAFDAQQQALFLRFVTSCSRAPLLGFKYLEPGFCVHRSGVGGSNAPDDTADHTRLPTAATCMNLLKLPPYQTKEALRQKLLYAITSGSGFDLS